MKKIKFAIILFYLTLFAGLALYDEKLDPEFAREMSRPLPETIEPGNAWLVFHGFESPKGVSPYVYGEEKLRKLKDAISAGKNPEEIYSVNDSKSELSFQGEIPSFYGEKDGGLLACSVSHPDDIAALLRNNRELLGRYKSLLTRPRYTEPLGYGYNMPIPRYASIRGAQRTRLLQLATKAGRGDIAGALAGVREDAEFWRLIARNSKTLISKLIALSALNYDLRFAAELGASRLLNEQELGIVRNILRPFDNGEVSLAGSLMGEARYMYNGMEMLFWNKSKKWSPEKLFFKRNASGNRMYADLRDEIRLAELTPRQFAVELKRHESTKTCTQQRIGLPFLYNPMGEFLSTIARPSYTDYIERGHNLEGLRRLSMLKVLSRQENIPPERMRQFLNSHSQEFGNPYTGAPMTWDSRKGSIYFRDISGEKPIDISLQSDAEQPAAAGKPRHVDALGK